MKQISLTTLMALLGLSKADVPAKCLRANVYGGTWHFYVSQDQQTLNLYQTKEVCTHLAPNRK